MEYLRTPIFSLTSRSKPLLVETLDPVARTGRSIDRSKIGYCDEKPMIRGGDSSGGTHDVMMVPWKDDQ